VYRRNIVLAYWGRKKKLVRILSIRDETVYSYYGTGEDSGKLFLPLVVDGKNVEEFEIVENEQLSML
jgi:hypothetical protein